MTVQKVLENIFLMMGGLAIFMYGMKMMGENLEKVAGNNMRKLLAKISNNKYVGVGVGAAATAIIQSSSATTVMVVGFVNVGLMTLAQSASVIMGANIGTTITAQLTSLSGVINITSIASLFAGIGLFMLMFSKKANRRKVGCILIGLGMLFIGLDTMSTAMKEFSKVEAFKLFMFGFDNPILLLLAGVVFTAIVQSSSAATGVLISMSLAGLVRSEYAFFILLGTNIGTCITAMLASIGATQNAKRAAVIHLLFNVIGSVIVLIPLLFFSKQITYFMEMISGGDVGRTIANFHTLFNILSTLLLLPFLNGLVFLSEKIVQGKNPKAVGNHLFYLDERILETPPIAVAQAIKETVNMGNLAFDNLTMSIDILIAGNKKVIETFREREEVINYLNREITTFLVKISSCDISESDEKLIGSLYHVVSDIERIGDYAENLVEHSVKMENEEISFSEEAKSEILDVYEKLKLLFKDVMIVFETRKTTLLKEISKYEDEVDAAKRNMTKSHIERLNKGECTPSSGAIYLSIASNLERIADHMTNVAFSVKTYTPKVKPITAKVNS